MGNSFWIHILVIALFLIALLGAPNAFGIGIVEAMSQFPAFDVVIGVATRQPVDTIFANKGFMQLGLEIIEFLAIAAIIEFAQGLVYEKSSNSGENFVNKIISFLMGILLRFAIVVILCYGKIKFGPVFSAVCCAVFAGLIIWGVWKGIGEGKSRIWIFISNVIIPLLLASADALGLIYVCEGIYRLATGLNGTIFLSIGIVAIIIVRGAKILIKALKI